MKRLDKLDACYIIKRIEKVFYNLKLFISKEISRQKWYGWTDFDNWCLLFFPSFCFYRALSQFLIKHKISNRKTLMSPAATLNCVIPSTRIVCARNRKVRTTLTTGSICLSSMSYSCGKFSYWRDFNSKPQTDCKAWKRISLYWIYQIKMSGSQKNSLNWFYCRISFLIKSRKWNQSIRGSSIFPRTSKSIEKNAFTSHINNNK